jgi:hypothetical protein
MHRPFFRGPVRRRRRTIAADLLHDAAAGNTGSARRCRCRCRRENIGVNVGVPIVMY